MTEQSQMPLVGPPKRRGWRDIVWFRPLTPSIHTALVVTRRGRLVSILPAGGPRVLSDYLAWPYDFREVDTRERLLVLDQYVESFESTYEFLVSLRLIYQVVQPDRVALDLEDVATELAHAVVQSLRLSGRSFGVEQDKTFEEHLQATLITSDALVQRVQLLGLALRRADVTVSLDEPTRAHAEALRFAMRERPLHFQVAVESLEPDRSFDVIVGGSYRLTERRTPDGSNDTAESAIQLAITRTLRRVGITFAPGDYSEAAKAMAEVLRKDTLLQSELSLVQAQLLRPTVQIQPDRSMVLVPRPNMLPDTRPEPMLRRTRQALPRVGRPPALTDARDRAPQQTPTPATRLALPPPESYPADIAARWATPPEPQPAEPATSQTLPLGDLPAPSDPIEGAYTVWPLPKAMPNMRALPPSSQSDDAQDDRAPWADLIGGAEDLSDNLPWSATPPPELSAPEPQPWDRSAFDTATQPEPDVPAPAWLADPPASVNEPAEQQPWDMLALNDAAQPPLEEQESSWLDTLPAAEPAAAEPQPWDATAQDLSEQPLLEEQDFSWLVAQPSEPAPAEPQPWDSVSLDAGEQRQPVEPESQDLATLPAAEPAPVQPQQWEHVPTDDLAQPALDVALAAEEPLSIPDPIAGPEIAAEVTSFLQSEPADDLGFSLDWSEPDHAEPIVEPPTSVFVPTDSEPPADDLGFSLDWSEPQVDPYTSAWVPHANTTATDDQIITAHWDEPAIDAPEPVVFNDLHAMADAAAGHATIDSDPALVFGVDSAPPDWEQAPLADSPAEQQNAEEDAAPASIEQGSPPWYMSTLHFADQLPIDSTVDNSGYASYETQEEAWDEPLDVPSIPSEDVVIDASTAPLLDITETPEEERAELSVMQSALDYDLGTDSFSQPSNEMPDHVSTVTIEPADALVDGDRHETTLGQVEPVAEMPSEQIARIIGMIQSYGPAWFKMWSLELKERPERLPVVLGEVTADPDLLTQAADPQVQSALVAALAAYTTPTTFLARLPAAAPVPRPAIAGQGTDEDDVPDWLSLRVKWNGHGGGA
jgi:hypothetical protein